MPKKSAAVSVPPTAVTSRGAAKTSCKLGLAERLEQQRGAGHKEGQGAEDRAGVLAQDVPPSRRTSHQDDEPDNEEAGQDA